MVLTNEGASFLDIDYIQVVQATVPDGGSSGPHSGSTDGSSPTISIVTETVTQNPTGGTDTPSPTSPPPGGDPNPKSSSVDVAAIAGGTVGGVLGLLVLGGALFLFLLRRRRNRDRDDPFGKPTLPILGDDIDDRAATGPNDTHGQDPTAFIPTPWAYPPSNAQLQPHGPSPGAPVKRSVMAQTPSGGTGDAGALADSPPSYEQSEIRHPSSSGSRPVSQNGVVGSSAAPASFAGAPLTLNEKR